MLHHLPTTPPDPLYQVAARCVADPRPAKMDLGVGVYRDRDGHSPVMKAIKSAEQQLVETQQTKAYRPLTGDPAFLRAMTRLVFGQDNAAVARGRIVAIQATGGTGALRLAAALISATRQRIRLLLGTPSWPSHAGLFAAEGIEVVEYSYWQAGAAGPDWPSIQSAAMRAQEGDLFLLHGACHNPTGVDLSLEQRLELSQILRARGAIQLLDTAYYGLGAGLEADLGIVRELVEHSERSIAAVSCSKTFGLYRERTGILFVACESEREAERVRSNLGRLSRLLVSSPPAHGAEAVALVLGRPDLQAQWRAEVNAMRSRLNGLRKDLASSGPVALEPLRDQHGIFAMLPLTPEQVQQLEVDFAIYMPSSGRANLAGLKDTDVPRFLKALLQVGVR